MEGRGERESEKGAESEGRRERERERGEGGQGRERKREGGRERGQERERGGEGIGIHEKSDTIIWDCHCTGILMVTTLLGEDFIEFRSRFV